MFVGIGEVAPYVSLGTQWRFGGGFLLCVERSLWWAMGSFMYPVWGSVSGGHLWDLSGWSREIFGELQKAVGYVHKK